MLGLLGSLVGDGSHVWCVNMCCFAQIVGYKAVRLFFGTLDELAGKPHCEANFKGCFKAASKAVLWENG